MAATEILGDDFFAYLKQAQQATQKAGGDLEEMMSSIKNDLETIEDQIQAPTSPSQEQEVESFCMSPLAISAPTYSPAKPTKSSRVSLGAVNPNTPGQAPGVRPTPSKFVTNTHRVTSISPSEAKSRAGRTPEKPADPAQLSEIQKSLASVAAAVEKLSADKSSEREALPKPPLVSEQDSPEFLNTNQSMMGPPPPNSSQHPLNQSIAHDPLNASMHPGMVS